MIRRKKQNLILGIIVLAFSLIAIIFSSNESSLSSPFGKNENNSKEVKGTNIIIPDSSKKEDILDENIETEVTPFDSISSTLYRVIKVVDGDTIDVLINEKTYRLRLIGLNTPETVDPRTKVECFGREASNRAKELLENSFVSLESDDSQGERDKYGRLLRYVFLADGTNYNKSMIETGFGYEYTYDLPYKYQAEFKEAQNYASSNKLGLWNDSACSGNK